MTETSQPPKAATPPSETELAQRLISGDITPAQFLGLSEERLYEIAAVGHRMLVDGRTQQALTLFKGLVASSPYDSVFHCHLAAAYVASQRYAEGMQEYTQALQLNIGNVDALAGRSELYLREGKVAEALVDIQAALKLDPEARRETTQRARTNLLVLKRMADEVGSSEPRKP
ncbi:BTAD domain-containing putative transcriptional regulator [Hyalangium versicolor]|uniref:BTAD domain-containing putative transcriptional regulator n=1 Tax=Hyalangium versicolor TaxID=2861190 RepID=UPI001CCD8816|nr:BTAD domain-containing putative transcriptional regulator [Hyalangium versicolor]